MSDQNSDEAAGARADLVSYSARLLGDGLAIGSAGNLSVRIADAVAITPSGVPYADIRPGMLAGCSLGVGPVDAAWLGTACGSLVATGLGSDAGIESLGQVLRFLDRAQPAAAARIAASVGRGTPARHSSTAPQQAKEQIHE